MKKPEKLEKVKLNTKVDLQEKTTHALLNILEDVEQEREKAEAERNKTLSIITHLADGLLFFDKDDRLSLVNYRAEKMLNISTRSLLQKSFTELKELGEFKVLGDLLGRTLKPIFRKELILGDNFIIEVSVEPVFPQGEKLGTLVVLHDISREKMVEKIKSEFVSLAAHQLRTPLSAIKWTLKMMLEGDIGNITDEQRTFVEKSYLSNERMINLVNDLLDVTRIEEGRYLFKTKLVNFEDIVAEVINYSKEILLSKQMNLTYHGPQTKMPKIAVDVEKIKLVIQNLIENAIKYTSEKGKIEVSLDYDKSKKEIKLAVKDNGVGIPKDQQARVFVKFFRGANIVRLDTEGTGLGLFISKNIVEAHGGSITFESEEDKGSTFHISLPLEHPVGI